MSSQLGVQFLGERYEDVPGGPWSADVLDVASDIVRGSCGWHISPVITEDLAASGTGGPQLLLPTLRPVHISQVRERRDDDTLGAPLTGWRRIGGGRLYRPAGWPRGVENVVASVEHGFTDCPDELLAVVAECARAVRDAPPPGVAADSKTVGSVVRYRQYVSTGVSWSIAAQAVIDRYRLRA